MVPTPGVVDNGGTASARGVLGTALPTRATTVESSRRDVGLLAGSVPCHPFDAVDGSVLANLRRVWGCGIRETESGLSEDRGRREARIVSESVIP